jgi:pimeloyl-ACP methyl ester carboxylesterase
MPTLLLAGADDERYAGIAAAMVRQMRGARLAIVPEAGHAVHLENPVPFWSLVCAFLSERRGMTIEEVVE